MDILKILYPMFVLGGLGIIFGIVLSIADKKFAVPANELTIAVRKFLGGANCGACGYAGCDAFAEAVAKGEAPINGCPPAGDEGAAGIAQVMGVESEGVKLVVARVMCQGSWGVAKERYEYSGYANCHTAASLAGGPKLCRFACLGLGDCKDACAFGAIEMVNGMAVIDEAKCSACGMCERECPRHVIKLVERTATVFARCRNSDTGRVARDVCMKACIACGICEKTCKFDAIHVVDGYAHIDYEKCVHCGECAAKCPCSCITVKGEKTAKKAAH